MRTPIRFKAETKYQESAAKKANTNLPIMARVGNHAAGVAAVPGRPAWYYIRLGDGTTGACPNRLTQCKAEGVGLVLNDYIYVIKARDRDLTYYKFHSFIQSTGLLPHPILFARGLIIPDNVAQGFYIEDDDSVGAGTPEYLRIDTRDGPAQVVTWNFGGADVDFVVAASVADALVVRGSDSQVTLGVLGAGLIETTAGGVLSSNYTINSTITMASGQDIDPTDATGQDLGNAGALWDLYTRDVFFGGATGTNVITVPNNLPDALHIVDAGSGDVYFKIDSSTAAEEVIINDGGDDVDFRVEGSGATHALFVQGSDGHVGANTGTLLDGIFNVYAPGGTVNVTAHTYSATAAHEASVHCRRARGTPGAEANVQAGDTIGSWYFQGWDLGAVWAGYARITASVDAVNQSGGRLSFAVRDAALATTERMYITMTGAITLAGPSMTVPDGWTLGQAAGPLIEFDNTNDYLEITGCDVIIGGVVPTQELEVVGDIANRLTFHYRTDLAANAPGANSLKRASVGDDVAINDILGDYRFYGYHTDGYDQAANIRVYVDATPGNTDMPGRIEFATSPDGTAVPTVKMTIKSGGAVLIGTTTGPTAGGTRVLVFGDNTADPTLGANTAAFYGKDVAGNTEAFATNEDESTRAQLTPHNFTLFTPDPSYRCPWSHYAIHPHIGYEIGVDMYGAVKAIEQLSGKQFIYERELPEAEKLDWNTQQGVKKHQADDLRLAEAMTEEVEVVRGEALEQVAETRQLKTGKMAETDRFVVDEDTGDVVKEMRLEVADMPTGRMIWRPKAGIRFAVEDGKFYRTKTEGEATFEEYILKTPPPWLKERIPRYGTVN